MQNAALAKLMMQSGSGLGGVVTPNVQTSLRLRRSASAVLGRSFSTPTNQNVYSLRLLCKRGGISSAQYLFGAGTNHNFGFNSSDQLVLTIAGTAYTSTPVYRDVAAFYDILYTQNGTTYTLYVNGSSVLTGASVSNTAFNTAVAHQLGAANSANYFDGVVAQICFVDGQALTPSTFGTTDSISGEWKPLSSAQIRTNVGTWGVNGCMLLFNGTPGATIYDRKASDTDTAGNNWTATNVSSSTGVSYDWFIDSPVNDASGTQPVGNYPTFNAVAAVPATASVTEGNLKCLAASNSNNWVPVTMNVPPSGAYYCECTITKTPVSSDVMGFGVVPSTVALSAAEGPAGAYYFRASNNPAGCFLYLNGSAVGSSLGAVAGDVFQLAIDATNGKLWIGKNNTWYSNTAATTGNPSTATNPTATTSLAGLEIRIYAWSLTADCGGWLNMGQRPFAYTPPTGFKALCTSNLSVTVAKPNLNFDAKTRAGTGAAFSVTGLGFQPDFVFGKGRSGATDHYAFDVLRGAQQDIAFNLTAAEVTDTQGLSSFNSDGWSGGTLAKLNTNAATYIDWYAKAGGAGSANTAGTISATVSVNSTAGISIVSYTGTGANATVGHGLGAAPGLVLVKNRNYASGTGWAVWHSSFAGTEYALLTSTAIKSTSAQYWNSTTPTSSLISLGNALATNGNGNAMIAYCFAEVPGFSKFGTYVGNANANGPFVYLGFRPRFLLVKIVTTSSGDWHIFDSARSTYNAASVNVTTSATPVAEATLNGVDFLSNGFKLRTVTTDPNAAQTYIYAAFAEAPLKYANAR